MFLPHQDIFIWAMVLSLIITVMYRIFTKPGEIRKIKEEMKFYREKANEAQKRKDTKKSQEYLSEMMKASQKQFKMNMKPMFVSMIVVIFLLGFVHQTYSGVVVETNENGIGYFSFMDFNHTLKYESESVAIDTNGNGDFSDEESYSSGEVANIGNIDWHVFPEEDKTSMYLLIRMPFPLPFFGYHLNWLMWYIICTLPATWIFRKLLGVE
ncbi:MAG: DUF106 domain-containing protein [Candidatus Aenigmarchaeota archaeon]|nr:DUF106 domain-containing protein [Candidatus Aenigmarchaeota archaeon]NIP40681.1 DUF106 domain-containing protein [Candidatus Aenigmarchaeota archaeon]NIQ18487.1 DUF106 domain-containing protein [Candidatus Aenigmarchaeota archaeon]NIS73386.1 DUF106 domain-containing protein [Candidatus Aenigmarchaeota archaeon]